MRMCKLIFKILEDMKLNDVFLIRFWGKLNKYLNGKHKFIRKNTEKKDRRKMFRYKIIWSSLN